MIALAWLLAYHAAATFEEAAATGGGGGVLYTGAPRWHGYDCGVCHLDAPGRASLLTDSDPLTLLTEREYTPEQVYELTLILDGENRGLGTMGNYNSVGIEILDADGEPVGGFFEYDADVMTPLAQGGALFSRGSRDETEWSFSWQAPVAGTGWLDVYLVAVDGDGAGDATMTATDPFGDDVIAGGFRIAEAGHDAPPFDRDPKDPGDGRLGIRRDVSACSVGAPAVQRAWWLVLLVAARRRRRAA